jgi:hypothetical protein
VQRDANKKVGEVMRETLIYSNSIKAVEEIDVDKLLVF